MPINIFQIIKYCEWLIGKNHFIIYIYFSFHIIVLKILKQNHHNYLICNKMLSIKYSYH